MIQAETSPFNEALAETLSYLCSPAALASIEADPYWPKWESPWWRVLLLVELGCANLVPREIVYAFSNALVTHYLRSFPFTLEEIPASKTSQQHVLCHCALGSIDRILRSCGVEVDEEHPWIRSWFTRYQITDGGWNCDETVYTRPTRRSSVVSTLPILEALLARTDDLGFGELATLDRGASYLIERRLIRSLSKGGQVANSEWLAPCFPRFYEYDLLRGLSFVVRWAELRECAVPTEAVSEVVSTLERLAPLGDLAPGRRVVDGTTTIRQGPDGTWTRSQATEHFPLLDLVSTPGVPNAWLSHEWHNTRAGLKRLALRGLLV